MELSQDERTRLLYEEREKARRDEVSRMNGARKEETLKIARRALKLNMSIEDIIALTDLDRGEIEKLRKES